MKYLKKFENYSSVANVFRGLRPSIKNLAILTAANPHGATHSSEFNKSANSDLESLLSKSRLGYRKVKGSYGMKEKSYIVFNIPYLLAIEIGRLFEQDSIIYGEVKDKKSYDDDVSMSFKMIGTDDTKPDKYKEVLGETNVFVRRDNAKDFYSEINGKKFVLPFYDVVDKLDDKKILKVTKDYTGSKWKGGKAEPTSIDTLYMPDWLLKWQEEHDRNKITEGHATFKPGALIEFHVPDTNKNHVGRVISIDDTHITVQDLKTDEVLRLPKKEFGPSYEN